MSFDGLVLQTIKTELTAELLGARIAKIYQPHQQEIVLHLHQKGITVKLLLSVAAAAARIHLTTAAIPNPPEPPAFCMVLRKHLTGGRLLAFDQPGLERILEINCAVRDELGEKATRKIILEIMGKHSNLILVNPAENKIIDALKRIPPSLSRYRQILPGLTYHRPPPQDKIIPWQSSRDLFEARLRGLPLNTKLESALLKICQGMSPQSIREIIYRTNLDPYLTLEYCGIYELNRLWQELETLGQELNNPPNQAVVIIQENTPTAFSAFPLTSYPPAVSHFFTTMNEALDVYYARQNETRNHQQQTGKLQKIITREIKRCTKKAALQQETIRKAENITQYRLWGELLTANLHNLSPGQEAQVSNYYDPAGKEETIPLDPQLSPLENAQRYFRQYQKGKNAACQATTQLAATEAELFYLQSLLNALENVTTPPEIKEIAAEMRESGYLKAPPSRTKGKKKKEEPSQPPQIELDSWQIYFGKNNKQNDRLTMKMAKKEDLWLHTQKIPGAHVLIKNPLKKEIPAAIIEKAAMLAAYHSPARDASNVPVDYTERRHVWKPQGAKPGFVLYQHQKTIFITPDPQIIQTLKQMIIFRQ